jgi:hypothetical protein
MPLKEGLTSKSGGIEWGFCGMVSEDVMMVLI